MSTSPGTLRTCEYFCYARHLPRLIAQPATMPLVQTRPQGQTVRLTIEFSLRRRDAHKEKDQDFR